MKVLKSSLIFYLFLRLTICSFAQEKTNSKLPENYDPRYIKSTTGTIIKIGRIPSDYSYHGVKLIFSNNNLRETIYLGPVWFISKQDFSLNVGYTMTIIGARAVFDNKQILIAKELIQGNRILRLRDDEGHPLWNEVKVFKFKHRNTWRLNNRRFNKWYGIRRFHKRRKY